MEPHRGVKKTLPGQPRARPINSCLACRDRKKGCDKRQPVCGSCMQNPDPNKPCIYAHGKGEVLKAYKQKMRSLKEALASSVADGTVYEGSRSEDIRLLEDSIPNPLIFNESAFEEDVEDDNADLGICLGKLRISDRIGGLFRPNMVEELTNALNDSARHYPEEVLISEYFQPSSSFTNFGPMTVAPSIHDMMRTPELEDECYYLPDKQTADLILSQYWERVHPVARVLHRCSFEKRWNTFWETLSSGEKREKSLLALVFTVLFSGLVSTPNDVAIDLLNYNKQKLMDRVRVGMEVALGRSNWIRSTKVEMLQAIVIYLISACREEASRAHSSLVAAAIRTAECIGLHKDCTTCSESAVETQVRRILWYQLLLLDIRTCEATGPRPQIREADFSTKLPLNVEEEAVHQSSNDCLKWTDMTVTIIRMRCNEFIREIWTDRTRLQEKQASVGEILAKIQAFDAYMQGKYCKVADMNVPIQRYGCLVAKILTLRTYAMILHQYALHPKVEMSDTMKKTFIDYGVETMDAIQDLETAPDLAPWRWLAGAIQQHHYALAMLLELLKAPFLSQAAALLRGIDYVFEPPQHLAFQPLARVRYIVLEMRNRMRIYVAQRKPRTPRSLHDSGELLNSEVLESLTSASSACTSSKPVEASVSPRASKSPDDQSVNSASTKPNSQTSKQIVYLSANERPESANLSWQTGRQLRQQVIDVNQPSLKQQSLDVVNAIKMTDREYMSITGGYPPDVSEQGELPVRRAAHNGYLYYSPQSDRLSDAPIAESEDERAQRTLDDSTLIHNRGDAFHGYSLPAAPSSLKTPLNTLSTTSTLPAYYPPTPSNNFLPDLSMQAYQSLPVATQDYHQSHHAFACTAPLSDCNSGHLGGNDSRDWYTSYNYGGTSVLQGALDPQIAHGGDDEHDYYERQQPDWKLCDDDDDVPAAFLPEETQYH